MNNNPDRPGPTPCPHCAAPVLIRCHAGNPAVIVTLDADPYNTGTYMITATTASVISGKGGWRYRLHNCRTETTACACACHTYQGTYPTSKARPCGVCGHYEESRR